MFSRLKVTTYSRVISKTCVITQSYSQNRALHVLQRAKNLAPKTNYLGCFSSSSVYTNTNFVRFASTDESPHTSANELPLIPDAPVIPPEMGEVFEEGTLQSIGLGSYYSPLGWTQHFLYWIHTTCGLPWWATIIAGTAVLRCAMFPLFVRMQRHHALTAVHKKELAYLDRKRKEATEENDDFRAKLYFQKQEAFYATHGMLTVRKMAMNYLIQGPAFCTFFLALNRMATAPLPSLREGGFAWFTDLTVTDPYYVLPVITSVSTALYMYLTPSPTMAASHNMQNIQRLKYAIPIIGLVVMIYLKAGVLFYVITSTWLTFFFQAITKVPKIRALCNIAPIVKQEVLPSENLPKASVLESIKDMWKGMRKNRGLRAAYAANNKQFQSAGRGPLIKTYKFDPTKVVLRKEIK